MSSDGKTINALDKNLKLVNGILFYNETPFSGKLLDYYDAKNLKSEVTYKGGRKNGAENGNILSARFYTEGFKTGIHKSWWPSGILKFEYHFNDKGEFHGTVKEWYKSGQPFRDFNYNKGKEEGKQLMWKSNGAIKANYEVIAGERFGLIGLKKCYTVTVDKDEVQ